MANTREAPIQVPEEDGFNEYESTSKRPKKTSDVWKHFDEVTSTDKNEIKAACKYCRRIMSAASKNGTSHLIRHVGKCPKRANKDIKQYMLTDGAFDSSNSPKVYKFDQDDLRRCISLFVVEGSHSFSIVEERGFRRMLSRANPQFTAFSRHTLRRELLALYMKERDSIKEMMKNAIGRICLTTDNWRNEFTKEEYICVTAHFIDSDWKLQKRILRFRALTPPYDSLCIADEILLCLSQWNIEHKIFTITADNASYNDRMLSMIKSRLVAKKLLMCNGTFFHVRCCAHILNLIVQAGLGSIKDSLENIREMVKYLYRSSTRTKRFLEIAQRSFQLQTNKKFRLDMPVRWNSTYKMLDDVLYYKDVFMFYGSRDHTMGSYALKSLEWSDVSAIHKFLKVFYEVTCMFSAVKTPTSNLYFKGVWLVHKALQEISNDPRSVLNSAVSDMQAKFDKYWSEYNEILSCAALLDPRLKVKFLQYFYGKIYGRDNIGDRVTRVKAYLHKIFEEYKTPNMEESLGEGIATRNSLSNKVDEPFGDYSEFIMETNTSLGEKSQLDLYLDEPTRDLNEELDVLDFWHKSSMRYPELSKMACDILSIPVSTIASESAFSIGGKTISSSRSSLKSKTIQAIICLRDWIKSTDDEKKIMDELSDSSSEDEGFEGIGTNDGSGTPNFY